MTARSGALAVTVGNETQVVKEAESFPVLLDPSQEPEQAQVGKVERVEDR